MFFFWTLPVLLQRWFSTCLVCVRTLTPRENREVQNILKSSEKTQYLMNTLYVWLGIKSKYPEDADPCCRCASWLTLDMGVCEGMKEEVGYRDMIMSEKSTNAASAAGVTNLNWTSAPIGALGVNLPFLFRKLWHTWRQTDRQTDHPSDLPTIQHKGS